jgi:hypothetical protein
LAALIESVVNASIPSIPLARQWLFESFGWTVRHDAVQVTKTTRSQREARQAAIN